MLPTRFLFKLPGDINKILFMNQIKELGLKPFQWQPWYEFGNGYLITQDMCVLFTSVYIPHKDLIVWHVSTFN